MLSLIKKTGAFIGFLTLIFYGAATVYAKKSVTEPESLGVFQNWEALKIDDGTEKLCWISAPPIKSDAAVERETPLLMVSRRPEQNILNEVSYYAGAKLVKDKPVKAVVDKRVSFNLSPRDEWAWIKNSVEESRSVNSLMRGTKLRVTIHMKSGHKINDDFSLIGFTAALEAAKKACASETAKGK